MSSPLPLPLPPTLRTDSHRALSTLQDDVCTDDSDGSPHHNTQRWPWWPLPSSVESRSQSRWGRLPSQIQSLTPARNCGFENHHSFSSLSSPAARAAGVDSSARSQNCGIDGALSPLHLPKEPLLALLGSCCFFLLSLPHYGFSTHNLRGAPKRRKGVARWETDRVPADAAATEHTLTGRGGALGGCGLSSTQASRAFWTQWKGWISSETGGIWGSYGFFWAVLGDNHTSPEGIMGLKQQGSSVKFVLRCELVLFFLFWPPLS